MEFKIWHWIGIAVGIVLAGGSMAIFEKEMLNFMLSLSLIIGSLPFLISMLTGQGKQREKEEKFLAFSRDLVESVRSGTPISKSIIQLRARNYGTLTPHIQKMANQLSLGLTLNESLNNFARDTNSRVIVRAVGLISEAERAGGKIESVLDSVSKSVDQIETLRKERKAAVSNLVTQGYMIFIVFIVIMLVLEFKILPLTADLGDLEGPSLGLEVSGGSSDPADFAMPLFVMLLVQSTFAGLVIGKISEGTIKSGFRHSFILLSITLLVTTGAKALFPVA